MKACDVEQLARNHLLAALPGFEARGSLTYKRPVDDLLHGLTFDTSFFSAAEIQVIAFDPVIAEPFGCAELLRGRNDERLRILDASIRKSRDNPRGACNRVERMAHVHDLAVSHGLEAVRRARGVACGDLRKLRLEAPSRRSNT